MDVTLYMLVLVTRAWGVKLVVQVSLNIDLCSHSHMTPCRIDYMCERGLTLEEVNKRICQNLEQFRWNELLLLLDSKVLDLVVLTTSQWYVIVRMVRIAINVVAKIQNVPIYLCLQLCRIEFFIHAWINICFESRPTLWMWIGLCCHLLTLLCAAPSSLESSRNLLSSCLICSADWVWLLSHSNRFLTS